MSTRFEILKNGNRVCICGINGDGVLSTIVNYVKHSGKTPNLGLSIGGLGKFDSTVPEEQFVEWHAPTIRTGDEITIRILEAGEFVPYRITSQNATIEGDPDFGTITYSARSWDADIEFASGPIQMAHVHIVADDNGPTIHQRKLFRDLATHHAQLWPTICQQLFGLRSDLTDCDNLIKQLKTHISIGLDDTDTIELGYKMHGDPESRSYYVTIRGQQIIDFCIAD